MRWYKAGRGFHSGIDLPCAVSLALYPEEPYLIRQQIRQIVGLRKAEPFWGYPKRVGFFRI